MKKKKYPANFLLMHNFPWYTRFWKVTEYFANAGCTCKACGNLGWIEKQREVGYAKMRTAKTVF